MIVLFIFKKSIIKFNVLFLEKFNESQKSVANGGRSANFTPRSDKSKHENFSPISSSTPSNHSSRDITLLDFVTPDRRRNKKGGQKQNQKSFTSPACGSWASNVGETDITPLGVNGTSSFRGRKSPPPRRVELTDKSPNTPRRVDFSINVASPEPVAPSRRITPTVVSANSTWHNFKQQAVFTPQSPKKMLPSPRPGDFSAERSRLKEKKAQFLIPIVEKEAGPCLSALTAVTPSKGSRLGAPEQYVDPQPESVTRKSKLDNAAFTFSNLISGACH